MKTKQIKKIGIPVQVVLGETTLSIEELAQLNQGSLVKLTSLAGEPVDLTASGEVIAKGEVVVMNENFGIRITQLLDNEVKNDQ